MLAACSMQCMRRAPPDGDVHSAPVESTRMPAARWAINWLPAAREEAKAQLAARGVTFQDTGPERSKWSEYLNAAHQRLHHAYSDIYLAELEQLGASDPANDPRLVLRVIFVVDRAGALVDALTVQGSGVSNFDQGAIAAIRTSAPFRAPPHELVSADGRTYVGWELFRDPVAGCSTIGTYPLHFGAAEGP